MKLPSGAHLAYCTNVHRGESWAETMAALDRHVLAVRRRVAPGKPYGLGLRLSAQAALELGAGDELVKFRRWLDRNDGYVFTINGFPYGAFHGGPVKERVYAPDWAEPARLDYTVKLFELLAELVPPGGEGSVSTVPGSFKGFMQPGREARIFAQLAECARRIDRIAERSGRDLHLGLEPEPLCLLETTAETVDFFERWRAAAPDAAELSHRVGVNYDCCHLAVEFENPQEALARLEQAKIRLSKVHLSSALKVVADDAGRAALASLVEPTYLHQVVTSSGQRFVDLDRALQQSADTEEWRVHFHIPLHSAPGGVFRDTRDHLLGALDWLRDHPSACRHLEMETYTWAVLPGQWKDATVEDQVVREYEWTLGECARRGL